MEECLITNKVCPNWDKKCKNCKLDECAEVFNMNDKKENKDRARKLRLLYKQLPVNCLHCNILEIIDLDKQIVRCPYMIKDKCLLT